MTNFDPGNTQEVNMFFKDLIIEIQPNNLNEIYKTIFNYIEEADQFIKSWTKYRNLFEIEITQLLDMMGDNLHQWTEILNDIKNSSKQFDSQKHEKFFGPIWINYKNVQNIINSQFGNWHKSILQNFGNKIYDMG